MEEVVPGHVEDSALTGRRFEAVEVVLCIVGIFEAYLVRFSLFLLSWSFKWLTLTPSRYIIDHNHKWFVYLVFTYLDASWAAYIISGAMKSASGNMYVYGLYSGNVYELSFGQV